MSKGRLLPVLPPAPRQSGPLPSCPLCPGAGRVLPYIPNLTATTTACRHRSPQLAVVWSNVLPFSAKLQSALCLSHPHHSFSPCDRAPCSHAALCSGQPSAHPSRHSNARMLSSGWASSAELLGSMPHVRGVGLHDRCARALAVTQRAVSWEKSEGYTYRSSKDNTGVP